VPPGGRRYTFCDVHNRAVRPGRIPVIDDEVSVRDLLLRVLADAGHDVTAVETGEAALMKLAKQSFDLLVVDKNLPGISGLDVLRLVRTHYPRLRAIVITAYPNPAAEATARELGVHGYVTKPFGIVTIVSAVDAAIEAGRAGLS
jgi:CheY-like chemotaxis protein